MKKFLIVLSHYGFQYPVGGLSVCLTRYPDRRSEHFYFDPNPYFQIPSLTRLYDDSALLVKQLLDFYVPEEGEIQILFPDDHFGHSLRSRIPHYRLQCGKIYGWVFRYARSQFAERLLKFDLLPRKTKSGFLPPTWNQLKEWVQQDPERAILYAKYNSLKWRTLWREVTGEEWEARLEKAAERSYEAVWG